MKKDDLVKVTWSDGDTDTGKFVREERGFFVFVSEAGKRFVCAKSDVGCSIRFEILHETK